MKSTDKITDNILIDLLKAVGLEKVEDSVDCNVYWCIDSEKEVKVWLEGNTYGAVLMLIKDYYYRMGFNYGENNGKRIKMNEIKKILEINQYG